MKHVSKSVLLWYAPREMYALVTRIEDYPQFLPWCDRAEVLSRDEAGMTARLGMHYAGMRHAFTTRNEHDPDRAVQVSLVDGPFSQLAGHWQFKPLVRPGHDSEAADACKVLFDLRYAFAGSAVEALISPVFDRIANTLVDAFVRRAETVYGPR